MKNKPPAYASVILLLILCSVVVSNGCTRAVRESISPVDLDPSQESRVLSVILANGAIVMFDSSGGHFIEQRRESRLNRRIVG